MKNLCLLAIAGAGFVYAQADVSAGDIKGVITDVQNKAIPRATVTATATERGITRATASLDDGQYRLQSLPPAAYALRIEASGFAPQNMQGIVVQVGQTVTLNVVLQVGTVSAEITVNADVPVVETERTQQANTIDTQRIENMPINRRNYLDFALLAPGVIETTDLVDSTDFRVVQTPQSGLSFGGGNGRGNSITIDGVENFLNSGGVRPSISQEAVQEFQINRNSYTAEFGNAVGGSINIVTKSGTNVIHGDLFGFLRHRDIQARNYFDPQKSAFTRGQEGGTLSAPLAKNKTFIFAAYERLDRHETDFVSILQDPSVLSNLTPAQQRLANYFNQSPLPQLQFIAAIMKQTLLTTNYPATVALFNANSGPFPFSESANQASLRFDHTFSPKNMVFMRASIAGDKDQNAQLGALVGFNRGRTINSVDRTVMLHDTYLITNRLVSETRLMFSNGKLDVTPTDPNGPDITISGYGSFGREIFLPSTTLEIHYQAQQVMSYSVGKHTLKFGADINPVHDHVRSETFFGGRFLFSQQIPFGALLDSAAGDPSFSTNLAASLTALGQPQLVPDLNQPITALQAYNLGLPILYQQGFGNPAWNAWFKYFNFFVQDSWKLTPRLLLNIGTRYELEGEPPPLQTDKNNIAPRIGLAWTPAADGKTAIRAAYGIYYAPTNGQIANLPATLDGVQIAQVGLTPLGVPGLLNPLTHQPLTSFDIYQTLAAEGILGNRTITQQDLLQFGLKPGPNAPGRVIFGITKDYVNLYAHQASLEVEHAFGNFAVSAGYAFNRGMRLPRMHDHNLYYTGKLPNGQPTYGFVDPAILQYNVQESTANSSYHALTLQVTKRFSRHFSLNAHYTFSKAIDETTDFNSDFEPQDQLNANAEYGLSSFDVRHQFVFSSVIVSPAKNILLRNFTLAPIVTAYSGRPFNILTGYDNVGDDHPTTHRPFGAGRNIGHGPGRSTIDLRLSRRFPFGAEHRRDVEFTAEGFNLLNHTNFKGVNSVVGDLTLQQLPNPIVGNRGVPTNPLSFTSAYDARQFQVGLKINF